MTRAICLTDPLLYINIYKMEKSNYLNTPKVKPTLARSADRTEHASRTCARAKCRTITNVTSSITPRSGRAVRHASMYSCYSHCASRSQFLLGMPLSIFAMSWTSRALLAIRPRLTMKNHQGRARSNAMKPFPTAVDVAAQAGHVKGTGLAQPVLLAGRTPPSCLAPPTPLVSLPRQPRSGVSTTSSCTLENHLAATSTSPSGGVL